MHLNLFSIETISITDPMNRTFSEVVRMASMIGNNWHDVGDADMIFPA